MSQKMNNDLIDGAQYQKPKRNSPAAHSPSAYPQKTLTNAQLISITTNNKYLFVIILNSIDYPDRYNLFELHH